MYFMIYLSLLCASWPKPPLMVIKTSSSRSHVKTFSYGPSSWPKPSLMVINTLTSNMILIKKT